MRQRLEKTAFRGGHLAITGGSGFLASALAGRLTGAGRGVLRVSRRQSPADAAGDWLCGDLRERAFCDKVIAGADVVFHLAAQTSAHAAESDPAADWQANVLPMRNLLDACRDSGARPVVVFAGSVTQCGVPPRTIVDESLPDLPVTAYDRHKLEAERLLEEAVQAGSARGCTLRLANVYGPGAARGGADRGILDRMMMRALRGETLSLYGEGDQLRDYLYVDDAIEAFVAAAMHSARSDGNHFVVGSGEGRSLAEAFALVARRAEMLIGRSIAVLRQPPPAGLSPIEERSSTVDASRFRAATGWSPRVAFVDGVDRSLAALQALSAEAG